MAHDSQRTVRCQTADDLPKSVVDCGQRSVAPVLEVDYAVKIHVLIGLRVGVMSVA